MKLSILSRVAFASTLAIVVGCKTTEEVVSETKFNLTVPVSQDQMPRFAQFYADVDNLMESSDPPALRVTDLILVRLAPAEKMAIDQAYPNPVSVTCQNNRCVGLAQGTEVTVPLSLESGADKLWLGARVRMEFRRYTSGNEELIEICRAEGMQFRQGFVWAAFDGAMLRYDAANPGRVRSMMVDIGLAGSYPSDDCR